MHFACDTQHNQKEQQQEDLQFDNMGMPEKF